MDRAPETVNRDCSTRRLRHFGSTSCFALVIVMVGFLIHFHTDSKTVFVFQFGGI